MKLPKSNILTTHRGF